LRRLASAASRWLSTRALCSMHSGTISGPSAFERYAAWSACGSLPLTFVVMTAGFSMVFEVCCDDGLSRDMMTMTMVMTEIISRKMKGNKCSLWRPREVFNVA
jgi:hypothetical protein